jgi:hypothetical protein
MSIGGDSQSSEPRDRPVRLRIARPAWDETRAKAGEQALRSLVLQAFALVDELGDQLAAVDGIAHDAACSALSGVGGTSDFGAFMTGFEGRGVLSEVDRSAGIRRLAGDRLDELLQYHIFNKARINPFAAGSKSVASSVRANQRDYKERLFTAGKVVVELVDDHLTVTKEAFLATASDADAGAKLRADKAKLERPLMDTIASACRGPWQVSKDRPPRNHILVDRKSVSRGCYDRD